MKTKRGLRPVLVILTVLFVSNGVYIVLRQGIFALIERYYGAGGETFRNFLRGSSAAELILFTGLISLCFLLAGILSRGRLSAAFYVLAAAWMVPLWMDVLAWPFGAVFSSAAVQNFVEAVLALTGCGLLAGAVPGVRTIGWISGAVTALARLCGAFSVFSASMMGGEAAELWKQFFLGAARVSPMLNIVSCILLALCVFLLLFALRELERTGRRREDDASASPEEKTDPAAPEENDGQTAGKGEGQ